MLKKIALLGFISGFSIFLYARKNLRRTPSQNPVSEPPAPLKF